MKVGGLVESCEVMVMERGGRTTVDWTLAWFARAGEAMRVGDMDFYNSVEMDCGDFTY